MPYNLNFQKFPICFSTIHLPAGAVVYRGSSTDPNIPTDPRFYSTPDMAHLYVNRSKNGKVWTCTLKKLRLLDVRMMKYMLLEALAYMDEPGLSRLLNTGSQSQAIGYYLESFMLSYGLRPMADQCEINLPKPLQNFGYRKSYTDRDDYAVALMKYIFFPEFDGYIAPSLKQSSTDPKAIEFHHELCLFDPSKSIESTEYRPKTVNSSYMETEYNNVEITDIIKNKHYWQNGVDIVDIAIAFPSQSGGWLIKPAIKCENATKGRDQNAKGRDQNAKGRDQNATKREPKATKREPNIYDKMVVELDVELDVEQKYNFLIKKNNLLRQLRDSVHSQVIFDLHCSDENI